MIRVVCKGCGASIPVEPKVGATTICTRCETPYVVSQRLIDRIAAKAGLRAAPPSEKVEVDDSQAPGGSFVRVKCNQCGKAIKVSKPSIGATYTCASCGHVLTLSEQAATELAKRLGVPMDAQQTILQAPRRLRGVANVGKPSGAPGSPPMVQPAPGGAPGGPGGPRTPGRPGQPKAPLTRGPKPAAPAAEMGGAAAAGGMAPQAKKVPLGPGAKSPMAPGSPAGKRPVAPTRANVDMPGMGAGPGAPVAPAQPAGGPPKRAPIPSGALMTDVGMPDLSDLKDLRVTPDELATPAAPLKRPDGVGRPRVTSEDRTPPVDTGQREIVMPSGRKIVVPETTSKRNKVEPVTLVPPDFKYDGRQPGASVSSPADPGAPMIAPISPPSELRTPGPEDVPRPFPRGQAPTSPVVPAEPVVPPPLDDEPAYTSPIHDEEYVSPLPPPDAPVPPAGPSYGDAGLGDAGLDFGGDVSIDAYSSGADAYGGDAQYDLGALTEGLGEDEAMSASPTPNSVSDSPFMHPSTADEDLFAPPAGPPSASGPPSSEIPLQDEFFASEQQALPPTPAEHSAASDGPTQSVLSLENELADYLGAGSEADRLVDNARKQMAGDDDLAALVAEVSAQSGQLPSSNIDVKTEDPAQGGSIFDIDKPSEPVPPAEPAAADSGLEEAQPWDAESPESRDVLAQMGLGDPAAGALDAGTADSYSTMERYDSLGDFKIDGLGAGADLFGAAQSALVRDDDDDDVDLGALAKAPAVESPAKPAAPESPATPATPAALAEAALPPSEQPFMPSSAMQSAASIQSPMSAPDDVRGAFEDAMGGDMDGALFGGSAESATDDAAASADATVSPPAAAATPEPAAQPTAESPVTTPEPAAEAHDFNPAANRDEMYDTMMTIPRPAGLSGADADDSTTEADGVAGGVAGGADGAESSAGADQDERVIAGSGGIVARDTRLRRRVETSAYSSNIDHVGVTRPSESATVESRDTSGSTPAADVAAVASASAAADVAPGDEPPVEAASADGRLNELSPSALAGRKGDLDSEDAIERDLLDAAGAWTQPAAKPEIPGLPSRRAVVPADALRSFAELVDVSDLEDDDNASAPAATGATPTDASVTSEDRLASPNADADDRALEDQLSLDLGAIAAQDDAADSALARSLEASDSAKDGAGGVADARDIADIDTMKTIVGTQVPDLLPPPAGSSPDAGMLPPPPRRETAPDSEELLPFESNFELAQTMAPHVPDAKAAAADGPEPSLEVVAESVFTPKSQTRVSSTPSPSAATPEDAAGAVDEIEEDVELAIGASELNMKLHLPGQRVVPTEAPELPGDDDDDDALAAALASAVTDSPAISTPEDHGTQVDDDEVIDDDVELAVGASELNIKLQLPGQRAVPVDVPDAPEEVEELDELDELDD